MANIHSQKKRNQRTERERQENRRRVSRVKTYFRRLRTAYWSEQAAFLEGHGVRAALEMQPGFVVYNPETLLRLRAEAGT